MENLTILRSQIVSDMQRMVHDFIAVTLVGDKDMLADYQIRNNIKINYCFFNFVTVMSIIKQA